MALNLDDIISPPISIIAETHFPDKAANHGGGGSASPRRQGIFPDIATNGSVSPRWGVRRIKRHFLINDVRSECHMAYRNYQALNFSVKSVNQLDIIPAVVIT